MFKVIKDWKHEKGGVIKEPCIFEKWPNVTYRNESYNK